MTKSSKVNNVKHIYPIKIPTMEIISDLDYLLIELPPRYIPMMPNGLAYVDLLLRREGLKSQVIDVNIIVYHRYHQRRLLEGRGIEVLANGMTLHEDPWSLTGIEQLGCDEVIAFFWPHFEELIENIIAAKPKVIGFSLNGTNVKISTRIAKTIRERVPDCCIIVGGYICNNEDVGPRLFTEYDYMVIGEAEVSLPPLAHALVRGERPKDLPGILSRWDSPRTGRMALSRPQNLDAVGWPKYDWIDLSVYRGWDGAALTPLCASRGCSWSKCRFCGERFPYRYRSPSNVVDELQYFVERGRTNFHFNESDVNGDPQNLYDICTEILNRELKLTMMGQLRIDKRIGIDFLRHLRKAGFRHLRFGVDGWSFNVLRLQMKGYNTRLIKETLKNAYLAGIWTTVNVVVGVPGETAFDVDEMIENLTACRTWIRVVESFNALILMAGSEYHSNPDAYNIKFVGDRETIYRDNPTAIPEHLWYSEKPYIDYKVRARRVYRIKETLHRNGIEIGEFTSKNVDIFLQSETGYSILLTAHPSGVVGNPVTVAAVDEYNGYKLYNMNGYIVAILGKIDNPSLVDERIGSRELLPYISIGSSERDIALKLRECEGDPDLDEFEMIHVDDRVIALHKSIPRASLNRDYLVNWEISPYLLGGSDLADVRAKIDALSVAAPSEPS